MQRERILNKVKRMYETFQQESPEAADPDFYKEMPPIFHQMWLAPFINPILLTLQGSSLNQHKTTVGLLGDQPAKTLIRKLPQFLKSAMEMLVPEIRAPAWISQHERDQARVFCDVVGREAEHGRSNQERP